MTQPGRARGAVLPRPASCAGGDGLLGGQLPDLRPEPDLPQGLPVGRGRGRALVDPRPSPSASRRPPAACPPWSRGRSSARRWRRTTASATATPPFGTVGLLAPLVPDVALLHARGRRPRRATWPCPSPLLEGVWGAWAARVVSSPPSSAWSRTSTGLGHRVKIPAHRVLAVVRDAVRGPPGRPATPGAPGSRLRRGHRASGSRRGGDPGRLRRLGPSLGPRARRPKRPTSAGSGSDRAGLARGRNDPESWRGDAEAHPVDRGRAREPLGAGGRRGAREV